MFKMKKMSGSRKIARIVAYCLLFAMLLGNQLIVSAAELIVANYTENLLTAETVGDSLYLDNVITLNNNDSFVGTFFDREDYTWYYGTSKDLVNWDIKSEYFSLVYGNNKFVGITELEGENRVNYTVDGIEWQKAPIPAEFDPISVRFENGYFKLYAYDSEENYQLLISKDAVNWYDMTNDMPEGAKVDEMIISNGNLYSLVGTSINNGTGFKVEMASEVNEDKTVWTTVESLCKEGYGMLSKFSFDGETVGVQLYSLADYNENNIGDTLYYVTTDFVNWEEKDWTQDDYSYYSVYSKGSSEEYSAEVDGKRFEAVETLKYEDENGEEYYVSSVVYSVDGTNWVKEQINIFVNGEKANRDPQPLTAYDIPENYEWARSGVEYSVGRSYVCLYSVEDEASRSDCLELIMQALNIPAPKSVSADFVPFDDEWGDENTNLIQRAKALGLVNGVDGINFEGYSRVSRQDMMVMIYNVLKYTGNIVEDSGAAALQGYADSGEVRDYAQIPVSSLIKAGIIQGDGQKINPSGSITMAEIMVIAERLNKFRMR